MPFTRRQFIKSSLAASAMGAFPGIWWRAAHALEPCETGPVNLVIVQLEGGNDGINTVVPMTNGSGLNRTVYDTVRKPPSVNNGIGIPVADLVATQVGNDPLTNGQVALHPHMVGLKALYDSGNLAVVLGVHYPDKNLSHEESEDIWYRADPTLGYGTTGWIGRTLDQLCSGQAAAVPAVDVQNELTPLFYGNTSVLAFSSIRNLNFPLRSELKSYFENIYGQAANGGAGFVKAIGSAGYAAVTKIDLYKQADEDLAVNLNDIINGTTDGSGFGVDGVKQSSQIARGLRTIYALMRGAQPGNQPLGCRIFRARIGGFDTHSRQGFHRSLSQKSLVEKVSDDFAQTSKNDEEHGRLMHRVSSSISAFWADLKLANLHKNTLIMTFSEFGRSVEQNQSQDGGTPVPGTDHSTAAPIFIVGPTAGEAAPGVSHVVGYSGGPTSGMYGAYQDLQNRDDGGDPNFQFDFRHVYGDVIHRWLGLGVGTTQSVLGGFAYSPQGIIIP